MPIGLRSQCGIPVKFQTIFSVFSEMKSILNFLFLLHPIAALRIEW